MTLYCYQAEGRKKEEEKEDREIKGIQIGKEYIKLFTDNKSLCGENPKIELVRFSKVLGYKINV